MQRDTALPVNCVAVCLRAVDNLVLRENAQSADKNDLSVYLTCASAQFCSQFKHRDQFSPTWIL